MRTDDVPTEIATDVLNELDDSELFDVLSILMSRRYWLDAEARAAALACLKHALKPSEIQRGSVTAR